jgi:hypothetical protein
VITKPNAATEVCDDYLSLKDFGVSVVGAAFSWCAAEVYYIALANSARIQGEKKTFQFLMEKL